MPTIWYEQGFRFSFYASDRGEPPQVHVSKGGARAKWWLEDPPREEWNRGFHAGDRGAIRRIVVARRRAMLRRWDDVFSPPER